MVTVSAVAIAVCVSPVARTRELRISLTPSPTTSGGYTHSNMYRHRAEIGARVKVRVRVTVGVRVKSDYHIDVTQAYLATAGSFDAFVGHKRKEKNLQEMLTSRFNVKVDSGRLRGGSRER